MFRVKEDSLVKQAPGTSSPRSLITRCNLEATTLRLPEDLLEAKAWDLRANAALAGRTSLPFEGWLPSTRAKTSPCVARALSPPALRCLPRANSPRVLSLAGLLPQQAPEVLPEEAPAQAKALLVLDPRLCPPTSLRPRCATRPFREPQDKEWDPDLVELLLLPLRRQRSMSKARSP